ncbi:MAG: hypothetical protein ACM3XO_17685 [Bacteroidota bacterium]|jgi:hypothetical protein
MEKDTHTHHSTSGPQLMKRYIPPLITIGLSLLLALCCAALTYSAPSDAKTDNTSGVTLQADPPLHARGKSEMGSTDQIVIMGGVISAIIIVPILMSRKSWR